jgi:hypothetical protein
MSDIVTRLRNWRTVHLARLHLLMEEAADEMERLRLTADEREAVAYYLGTGGPYNVDRTLVALLSRTGKDGDKTGDDATGCRLNGEKTPERDRNHGGECFLHRDSDRSDPTRSAGADSSGRSVR